MKHFFFLYNKHENQAGMLNGLFEKRFKKGQCNDENLKVLYDAADIICDKRLEEKDDELKTLVQGYRKGEAKYTFLDNYRSGDEGGQYYRIRALKMLWRYIEEDPTFSSLKEPETEKKKDEIRIRKVLYHLARGNICLRISQCYYENYDLDNSDIWGSRAIEIFWHGKLLAAMLRDKLDSPRDGQMDLYLRLLKLNIAKYYRDYARKNRRSDFDAALDEFLQVSEEIEKISDRDMSRQYVLIWMDAIFNMIKIHRRRYAADIVEREVLVCYNCLREDDCLYNELIGDADKLAKRSDYEKMIEGTPIKNDISNFGKDSFNKCRVLDVYDKIRYFLLILLEISRIYRDLHDAENYMRAMAMAIIADEWSCRMDKRDKYVPDHNIDALITISSSLRKYVKFGEASVSEDGLPDRIQVSVEGLTLPFSLRDENGNQEEKVASLRKMVEKLQKFAKGGHLKSKTEVIKWHCLYRENEKILHSISELVGKRENIEHFYKKTEKEKKRNIQLQFMEGLVLLRSKKYKEAITVLEQLIAPDNKATQYVRHGTIGLKARYLLANAYMSLAKFAKAEKILKELLETLSIAQKSQGQAETADGEVDARIEIDLGYCYMQRGEYEKAIEIYRYMYGDGEKEEEGWKFNLPKTKRERRIMGLNNYAACCILSINEKQTSVLTAKDKIEMARKIFCFLGKEFSKDKSDPETNLLKGYYTLCVGVIPDEEPVSDDQVNICSNMTKPIYRHEREMAVINAHEFFRKACEFDQAFAPRYSLLDESGKGNLARYRNEVERISCYIINLTKLYKLFDEHKNNLAAAAGETDSVTDEERRAAEERLEYLSKSKLQLERFLLGFPTTYKISLKAAIALAEWLLKYEDTYGESNGLMKQLLRSFSYVTIYEERGAQVFNVLRDNRKFRHITAEERGRYLALLLAMYKPIKAIKEECCFNLDDKQSMPELVHYTKLQSLQKILSEGQEGQKTEPHFRIDNCGFMNDVFEGITFLKSIALVSGEIKKLEEPKHSELVEKYFPQLSRSHEDMLPSGSNVYIGSLSVKKDSFPMWTTYAEKEKGCNITFGDDFFDINGNPCLPKALREYMLSKYTDQDYPLYIVQYIGSQFEEEYKYYQKQKADALSSQTAADDFEIVESKGVRQHCGTEALAYASLFRLLEQIFNRWKQLETCLDSLNKVKQGKGVAESIQAIRAFAADRINEIRFLFKNADYEFEGEVRVVYTYAADGHEIHTDENGDVPKVYVNIDRELRGLTVRLGSRIEDATVDKYVTWLKQTKRVKKVGLSKRNRYIK